MSEHYNNEESCRGIPRGCVEMGQDRGGLEPMNRERRERTAFHEHTETVGRQKDRGETIVGHRLDTMRQDGDTTNNLD